MFTGDCGSGGCGCFWPTGCTDSIQALFGAGTVNWIWLVIVAVVALRYVFRNPVIILRFGQLVVTVVLFAMMLQCFSKMIVVAEFYANRDYIARNLCVNRLNTAVHCAGRCQLDKRILQEEKSSGDKELRQESRNEVLSSRSFFAVAVAPVTVFIERAYPVTDAPRPVDRSLSIFHPPGWLLV